MNTFVKNLVFCLFSLASFISYSSHAIDLDNGNAAIEVVIPSAIPAITEVSPSIGDATLVLRFTTMITNSWYDATAPYHPTAVGVYSDLGRRPPEEAGTNRNINIALLYASYHILNSLFPTRAEEWDAMLLGEGLDPTDDSLDLTTAVGLGNASAAALLAFRENDGMNQLGNEGGRQYNSLPYADYTGFIPANTAYQLKFPSKWQPAIVADRTGIFRVQQFVTPQLRNVSPYSYKNVKRFKAPFPADSQFSNFPAYVAQAEQVLEVMAELTDEQKMMAELFDDKISSLGFSAVFASQVRV